MSASHFTGRTGTRLMLAAGVVVVATVVVALFVMDSPARQRAERLDRIRVEHLQTLSQRIDAHADVHDALPERLRIVSGAPGRTIADPATGQPYDYEVTGERSYRLCATFETTPDAEPAPLPVRDAWRHDAGRQCFEREVGQVVLPGIPVPARD